MLSPVDEIKSKIDIVDLIQEYLPLKPSGANFKALCPFHEEKTPSFMVSREKQFYHCFGCHESGDIFTFIQKMENVDFPEALKILANKAGVRLPEYNPQSASLKTKILEMNELAREWFQGQLFNAQTADKAKSYLIEQRGLDELTIKKWGLGYALDSWDALSNYLKTKGYSDEEIIQSGLVVVKSNGREYYDRFRDRIIFPIEDYHGNVVGFTGRAMKAEESAKYVNTPQTLAYNKSEVVFGLYQAKAEIKKQDKVIVVEGNMDVISSHQAGIKNVVAVSGTAFTAEQIKILQRLTNNFVFAFDADEAGQRAAERSVAAAWQAEANAKVLAIDKELGKDPDEIIRHNKQQWLELVKRAKPAMDYFLELYVDRSKLGEVEYKKSVAAKLLSLVIKVANLIERDMYIKKLAEKLDVAEDLLREVVEKKIQKKTKPQPVEQAEKEVQTKSHQQKELEMVKWLLAAAFKEEEFFQQLKGKLDELCTDSSLLEVYKMLDIFYNREQFRADEAPEPDVWLIGKLPQQAALIREIEAIRQEMADLTEKDIVKEMERMLAELKRERLKIKLRDLEVGIKSAEQALKEAPDEAKKQYLNGLLEEYVNLSNQLKL